ncbi:hypothetical protein CH359_18180 [Leptospira meyeri]|nr:hypothetical protein CH359_18180 [Leptospira meyeri]PJZ98653.1 hypothetical protein CH358_07030 [Leptospira meyeri]
MTHLKNVCANYITKKTQIRFYIWDSGGGAIPTLTPKYSINFLESIAGEKLCLILNAGSNPKQNSKRNTVNNSKCEIYASQIFPASYPKNENQIAAA